LRYRNETEIYSKSDRARERERERERKKERGKEAIIKENIPTKGYPFNVARY